MSLLETFGDDGSSSADGDEDFAHDCDDSSEHSQDWAEAHTKHRGHGRKDDGQLADSQQQSNTSTRRGKRKAAYTEEERRYRRRLANRWAAMVPLPLQLQVACFCSMMRPIICWWLTVDQALKWEAQDAFVSSKLSIRHQCGHIWVRWSCAALSVHGVPAVQPCPCVCFNSLGSCLSAVLLLYDSFAHCTHTHAGSQHAACVPSAVKKSRSLKRLWCISRTRTSSWSGRIRSTPSPSSIFRRRCSVSKLSCSKTWQCQSSSSSRAAARCTRCVWTRNVQLEFGIGWKIFRTCADCKM